MDNHFSPPSAYALMSKNAAYRHNEEVTRYSEKVADVALIKQLQALGVSLSGAELSTPVKSAPQESTQESIDRIRARDKQERSIHNPLLEHRVLSTGKFPKKVIHVDFAYLGTVKVNSYNGRAWSSQQYGVRSQMDFPEQKILSSVTYSL